MMDEIEKIASKVLGKTSDGKTMMRYETPEQIDPSLLVGIPRHLNRTHYNLTGDEFVGRDTWNAYEFSCLLDNGFPLSGWLRWSYPADSENIVESKSAKLYLNSYNMARMGATIEEAVDSVELQVHHDMRAVLGLRETFDIDVRLYLKEDLFGITQPMDGTYIPLEEYVEVENMIFNHYNEDPAILQVVDASDKPYRYRSNSLRSNCRVTNQPDWGDIYVHIKGDKTVTPESLLQYIVSMRKENHFHEEICECVYKRLSDLLEPVELVVACLYTRRGGIDINPIRASDWDLVWKNGIADAGFLTAKTMRQ